MVLPKPIKNCFNISLFNAAKEITKSAAAKQLFPSPFPFLAQDRFGQLRNRGGALLHTRTENACARCTWSALVTTRADTTAMQESATSGENRFSDRVQALVPAPRYRLANALCDGVAIHGGGRLHTVHEVEPPPRHHKTSRAAGKVMFDGAVDTILQRRGRIPAIGYQKAQAENAIEEDWVASGAGSLVCIVVAKKLRNWPVLSFTTQVEDMAFRVVVWSFAQFGRTRSLVNSRIPFAVHMTNGGRFDDIVRSNVSNGSSRT